MKKPPYLRYDGVLNRTNETWVIPGRDGEVLTVKPGEWVVTEPVVVPNAPVPRIA